MEQPRAWTEPSLSRRIALALLCGSLLKAIAASFEAIPTGPWDRNAQPSAGRLAHHLAARVPPFCGSCPGGGGSKNLPEKSRTVGFKRLTAATRCLICSNTSQNRRKRLIVAITRGRLRTVALRRRGRSTASTPTRHAAAGGVPAGVASACGSAGGTGANRTRMPGVARVVRSGSRADSPSSETSTAAAAVATAAAKPIMRKTTMSPRASMRIPFHAPSLQ